MEIPRKHSGASGGFVRKCARLGRRLLWCVGHPVTTCVRAPKWAKLSLTQSLATSLWRQFLWLTATLVALFFVALGLAALFSPRGGTSPWDVARWIIDPGAFSPTYGETLFSVVTFLIVVFGAILFSGMLISVCSNFIERIAHRFRSGESRFGFRDHIVLLGYDLPTTSLIHQICLEYPDPHPAPGIDIVLVTSQEIEAVRAEILPRLTEEERRRLIFIHADIASADELRQLHVDRALRVFIAGERDSPDHDTTNILATGRIARICEEAKRPAGQRLECDVLLHHQTTYAVFQLTDDDPERLIRKHLVFRPFNLTEAWAQKVLVYGRSGCADHAGEASCGERYYEPLDRRPLGPEADEAVHLVLLGMTATGISMATTAAQIAHYPNFHTLGRRTRITFVDRNATQETHFFRSRYPHLFELSHTVVRSLDPETGRLRTRSEHRPERDFLDVEWEFIEAPVEHPALRGELEAWARDEKQLLTLAVCFNTPAHALAAGLYLPPEIYERRIPVLIQQRTSDAIVRAAARTGKYSAVRPFGMLSKGYELTETDIRLAKGVNSLYEHYFGHGGSLDGFRPDADLLDEEWDRLSIAKRWSNIHNANSLPSKLRAMGRREGAPGALRFSESELWHLARVEHARWNMEQLLLGIRPMRDPKERKAFEEMDKEARNDYKLKAHPDLRPFDELDFATRRIDYTITEGLALLAEYYAPYFGLEPSPAGKKSRRKP